MVEWMRAKLASLWPRIKKLRERNRLYFDLSIVAALITLAVCLAFYEFNPGAMTVLASNLSDADRTALALRLRRNGIKFVLGQDSISVPERDLARAQALLEGGPTFGGGTTGFALFDQGGFGRSDFEEQVAYQRSLQGELERTIMDIRGIESARVMLAMPHPSPFALGAPEAARASVLLTTAPGAMIDTAVAGAIAHLVASSVHGLRPEAVTVTVNDGLVLYPPPDRGELSDVIRVRDETETRLKNKVSSLLQKIMGASRFAVEVAVTLDTSHATSKEEIFGDGNGRAILSEQHSSEPPPTAVGGIPGLTTNLPRPTPAATPTPAPGAATSPPSGAPNSSTVVLPQAQTTELARKDIINYQPSKREISTVSGPMRILQISVAVVLDGTYEGGVFAPLPPKRLEAIKNLVAAAVGAQVDRGDVVDVESAELSRPYVPPPPSPATQVRLLLNNPLYLYGSLGISAALVLGILWLIARRVKRRRKGAYTIATSDADLIKQAAREPAGATPSLTSIDDIQDYNRLRQEMNQEAENDPEAAAAILRSWMEQVHIASEERSAESIPTEKAA